MRKRLTLAAALTVAGVVIAVAAAGAAQSPVLNAPNGNTQSIAVKFLPQKLSKTKSSPVTLDVRTATSTTTAANGVPVPAVEAIVDFPKGVSIFNKGYPTCDPGLLQNTSTEAALEACKRARIGSGSGTADLVVGDRVFPVGTTITAFNGIPVAGKPVILLHTYSQSPIQTTLVLIGAVSNYNKEGFGPRLDVTIPLIAGGQGAITSFHVKIFKTFNYKGVKRSYVSATCRTKKLRTRGNFIFRDGESLAPQAVPKCTQRK